MSIKIKKDPDTTIHYFVDSNFFLNKYLNHLLLDDSKKDQKSEKESIIKAKAYWKIIDKQLKMGKAKVFILDIAVAEVFKNLAKKYYDESPFYKNTSSYKYIKDKIRKDIRLTIKKARSQNRMILYHDIQTNRDIIISVDRYFENLNKHSLNVQLADLLILATSKYLLDFYDFNMDNLYFITQDRKLQKLSKKYQDHPNCLNPSINPVDSIFTD